MAELYQHSHFLAVSEGIYDGTVSIADLPGSSRYGLGTFHALNGELVVIAGEYYQCIGGVLVKPAKRTAMLPWVAVTDFTASSRSLDLPQCANYAALEEALFQLMATNNYPFVFHLQGTFSNLTIGSVKKQNKPYKKIAEIINESHLIETGQIKAQLVGFYAPEFMQPIKSTGFHLHCLSDDKKFGGHVLELSMLHGTLCFERITAIQLTLPEDVNYAKANFAYQDYHTPHPQFSDRLTFEKY